MSTDRFQFSVPMDVVKSEDEPEDEMRIGGYASTSDEDRQGDVIIQKGLDYSDFVNYGFFNYDHKSDKVLGYPDKDRCHIDKHGFYVEGTLLHGSELAKSIWDTALELKRTNAPRHLGFSIEGKVLSRNSLGKIVKAKIYNVAITYNPVNPNATWDALVKSFTSDPDEIDDFNKSLDAGNDAEPGTGRAIMPESLDSALRTLSYTIGDNDEARKHLAALKSILSGRKDITKSELVLYFQLTRGLSLDKSMSLVDKIIDNM